MRFCASFFLILAFIGRCNGEPPLAFEEEEYCLDARDYLSGEFGNLVRVDPDTIDDWRTRQMVLGCRVYASEATELDMAATAQRFYDRVMSAGWTRTPNPRDMPNEAAIRLRMDDADCLFHVYNGPLIGTPSEIEVSSSVETQPGEQRYNVLVQCMQATEAAPR